MSRSIVILTEDRYESPKKKNWYINNVLTEDFLLLEALVELGFKVSRVSWSSKKFDWSSVDYAIFRTTWDYFERRDEFFNWISCYSKKIKFINSFDLIRWNLDKIYLRDFPKKNIVPSLFLKVGAKITLQEIFKKTNWEEIVIKPSISAASWNTYRVSKKNINKFEPVFSKLKKEHKMIAQEFQKNVLTDGELSFVVFGGVFSHAVLKKPKKNDYRVQDDFGGTVTFYKANQKEVDFAEKIVGFCPAPPLYARVDVLYGEGQKPLLSELEIIEPELWFRFNPKSAKVLAKKIFNFINF